MALSTRDENACVTHSQTITQPPQYPPKHAASVTELPSGMESSVSVWICQLDAWNWEDAAIKYDQGIHLNWPSPYTFGRWWLGEDRGLKRNMNYSSQIENVRDFFDKSFANMNTKKSMNLKSKAGSIF